jgi:4a-hydroxytetrahydrobiopterin dehydratase
VAPLDDDSVRDALTTLPAWRRDGDTLVRSVEAATFLEGIGLVDAVAHAAEEADHHPDIDIRWRTVSFVLTTHSAGGITQRDLDLARVIDGLAG